MVSFTKAPFAPATTFVSVLNRRNQLGHSKNQLGVLTERANAFRGGQHITQGSVHDLALPQRRHPFLYQTGKNSQGIVKFVRGRGHDLALPQRRHPFPYQIGAITRGIVNFC